MPVVPITSACNLDCPICYTVNKNESAHRLSKEAMQKILDHLLEDHPEVRDGRVQIVDGLKPGDQVVTAGQNKIDQGTKVLINNSVALKAEDSATIQ